MKIFNWTATLVAVIAPTTLFAQLGQTLPCASTGQRHNLPAGTCAAVYLHATEQGAIDAAVGALSPDSCQGCPMVQVGCEEVNQFRGGDIEVTVHEHPDGRFSAEACTVNAMQVWTACGPCDAPVF